MKRLIAEVVNNARYESADGTIVVAREYSGLTPNGNAFNGRWVLRENGNFVDVDKYRNDLFERNELEGEDINEV